MADFFISHATVDSEYAKFLERHLSQERLSVFLAPVSLQPGQRWSSEILTQLNASSWVLFLASRAACESPWVQQELGAALATQKKLIPIIWNMSPSELPGWTREHQALDLREAEPEQVRTEMSALATRFKSDRATGIVMAGLLIAGLFIFGKSE